MSQSTIKICPSCPLSPIQCSSSSIISLEGIIIPENITAEFIHLQAFNPSPRILSRRSIIPLINALQLTESQEENFEYFPVRDYDSQYKSVKDKFEPNLSPLRTLGKSQSRTSKRCSRQLERTFSLTNMIPSYDYTIPICTELLNDIPPFTFEEFVSSLGNMKQLKENYGFLKTNNFVCEVHRHLEASQKVALSIMLLKMTSSSVFRTFQLVDINKEKYTDKDIKNLQHHILELPNPTKQLMRRFTEITKHVKEMAYVFSGFVVSDDSKEGFVNKLGYGILKTALRYESFVLKGIDETGIYDFKESRMKVALCLSVETLSTLLFSKDSVSLGYVRFYMTTLPYFTTQKTVLQFIKDNVQLTTTDCANVYFSVCKSFLEYWGDMFTESQVEFMGKVSLNYFTEKAKGVTDVKGGKIPQNTCEEITGMMFKELRRMKVQDLVLREKNILTSQEVTHKQNCFEDVSMKFNKWCLNELITTKDYKKMLILGAKFLELKNYDATFSVYCGLKSSQWKGDKAENYTKKLQKDKNFRNMEMVFNGPIVSQQYDTLILKEKAPFIPVFVLENRKLLLAEEIPTYVDATKTSIRIEDKLRKCYSAVNTFIRGRCLSYPFVVKDVDTLIQKYEK
ncbi:hypothetical protein EIN_486770 [Entamoeba invadens IP1]|uniref:Ras-GEF domain-containing protein n=1 Tax=Entamoeba invadens IP1 TaxID=370355 RepID=A0A0A1U830_ENTIV|nr:hypothetical protein EIN_486770 [Entamoeba invadens IP1]ELP89215.1 hypothetical protein EIN_486770 [Entamoeba invadens IP1]|eukprot:XP_004255986.1 hypothetical protein EIN_486770 [Entamoeba invadens IP1]